MFWHMVTPSMESSRLKSKKNIDKLKSKCWKKWRFDSRRLHHFEIGKPMNHKSFFFSNSFQRTKIIFTASSIPSFPIHALQSLLTPHFIFDTFFL